MASDISRFFSVRTNTDKASPAGKEIQRDDLVAGLSELAKLTKTAAMKESPMRPYNEKAYTILSSCLSKIFASQAVTSDTANSENKDGPAFSR